MSASREKRQRQGGTPSDKALSAQQQEQLAQRKSVQYTVIGIVVALLVIALLVWDAGFIQRNIGAAQVNGTTYSAGEVSYYYHAAYQNTVWWAQYIAQNGVSSSYDTGKSPQEQIYSTDEETGEQTSYHDYFLQSALDNLASVTPLYDAARAEGYTDADVKEDVAQIMEEAKQTATRNGYSSLKHFLTVNYGKLVTPAVYERVATREALASRYAQDRQEALSYSDQQLQAYYGEHADELDTFVYSVLYFAADTVPDTDEEGNPLELSDEEVQAIAEENMAAAKVQADEALAALEDGDALEDVIAAHSPASSDVRTVSEGNGTLHPAYAQWLCDAARQEGDMEVLEYASNGYYVTVFHQRYLDQTPTVDTRHILVRAATDDGADAPTEEQMAAARTRAEELLSQWQTGEATEESFAALAEAESEDSGSNTNGGLYERVYQGNFVTNYDQWLFADGRKPGDTAVIENNGDGNYYGAHAVYYVRQNSGDAKWKVTVEGQLSQADMEQWQNELAENAESSLLSGVSFVQV